MRPGPIIAAALFALAVSGCSASATFGSSEPSAAPTASVTPADPVAILRQSGAEPDPGTVYGSHDVFGDRMASGSFPGGESVTVYTSGDRTAYQAEAGRIGTGDDLHGVVVVPAKLAVIGTTGTYDDSNAITWGGPDPRQIAVRIHGRAILPGGQR